MKASLALVFVASLTLVGCLKGKEEAAAPAAAPAVVEQAAPAVDAAAAPAAAGEATTEQKTETPAQ